MKWSGDDYGGCGGGRPPSLPPRARALGRVDRLWLVAKVFPPPLPALVPVVPLPSFAVRDKKVRNWYEERISAERDAAKF